MCSSWRRPRISRRSRHSRRTVPTQRSMCAFAFGARTGVRMTLIRSLSRKASKARGNFASRSWIRNRSWRSWSSSANEQVARLLQHPGRVRLAGDRELLEAAAPVREEDEHVEAAQPDGLDGEEVAGEDRLTLRSKEAAPGVSIALWRRWQTCLDQDVAHGTRRDRDAERAQLASDPKLAAAQVLAREA